MTVDTKRNPDGSVDLLIDGRVAISGESVQVVDNIAWALRHPSNGGVYDVSEADEVAQSIKEEKMYNGWKNRATWNVALWIGNDEGLYGLAREYAKDADPYKTWADHLLKVHNVAATPDGVAYNDASLDIEALDDMIRELAS